VSELFIEEDVVVRRTSGGVILAVLIVAGLVVGLLGVAVTAFVVSVSHTEQGLCGGLGVPCTTLSTERVADLSGLSLPPGTTVTGAYYNHTSTSTIFWASVQLPAHASVSLDAYQPYGTPTLAAERDWARRMHTLVSLGSSDGNTVRSVISAVDRAGHRELFLSFSTGS
jgi:hypothetical protein